MVRCLEDYFFPDTVLDSFVVQFVLDKLHGLLYDMLYNNLTTSRRCSGVGSERI